MAEYGEHFNPGKVGTGPLVLDYRSPRRRACVLFDKQAATSYRSQNRNWTSNVLYHRSVYR